MDAVAKLIAIEEIKQVKARYFRLMDTRDFDGMADVFCRDAVFDCSEGLHYTPSAASRSA
ncbi:MAG: nuclear transport factor 2 family protein [Bradyrhizobium sp.]